MGVTCPSNLNSLIKLSIFPKSCDGALLLNDDEGVVTTEVVAAVGVSTGSVGFRTVAAAATAANSFDLPDGNEAIVFISAFC